MSNILEHRILHVVLGKSFSVKYKVLDVGLKMHPCLKNIQLTLETLADSQSNSGNRIYYATDKSITTILVEPKGLHKFRQSHILLYKDFLLPM